ncbi:MAG TPA: AmmeMemoRadiSam system protein B [Rectinemataceae bacterium]
MAGIFYPQSGPELSVEIAGLVARCEQVPGSSRAIVSPHGSLPYSGLVSAAAWLSTQARKVDRLVILSPSHRALDPAIFLPESSVFSIPGSSFAVDKKALADLADSITACVEDDIPHLEEHGVEMQLIFAAYFHPHASIVPLIVSGSDPGILTSLFAGLYSLFADDLESTLFVISSNMAVAEDKVSCLERTEEYIAWLSPSGRGKDRPAGAVGICGAALIEAFMGSDLGRGLSPNMLERTSSAPFAEAGEPIVGYAAIGLSP